MELRLTTLLILMKGLGKEILNIKLTLGASSARTSPVLCHSLHLSRQGGLHTESHATTREKRTHQIKCLQFVTAASSRYLGCRCQKLLWQTSLTLCLATATAACHPKVLHMRAHVGSPAPPLESRKASCRCMPKFNQTVNMQAVLRY